MNFRGEIEKSCSTRSIWLKLSGIAAAAVKIELTRQIALASRKGGAKSRKNVKRNARNLSSWQRARALRDRTDSY
jgi:hypothetical protein